MDDVKLKGHIMNALSCNTEDTHLSNKPNSKLTTPVYSLATSEDYNLCNIIRSVLGDYDLSPGAQRVLIFLIVSSGKKGYTYLLVNTIAQRTRSGRTQTKQYIRELEQKDRIRAIRRPGRSSVYQIVGIYGKSSEVGRNPDHIKKYVIKNKTVTEPTSSNVFCELSQEESRPDEIKTTHHESDGKICSPDPAVGPQDHSTKKIVSEPLPKPKNTQKRQVIRFTQVHEILELTHDRKSKAFWIKLCKHVDAQTVYYMISSLRLAMNSGLVESPGKYLVGICKRICPWVFEIQSKKQAARPSQLKTDGQIYARPCQSEPVQDLALGLESIRRIREMLGRRVA